MKISKETALSIVSSLVVIVVGLLFGLGLLFVSRAESAWPAFMTILTFGVGNMRNAGDVLLFATPLILTGLSVAFAYRTGLFNIGASGQFTLGAFVAVYVGVEFGFMPAPLRITVAIVGAALAGALWAAIPGVLKAYRNVHEVIACIMSNYIAMFLANYLIITHIFDQGRATSLPVLASSNLPSMGLDLIFRDHIRGSHVNLGIFIAVGLAILVYILLEKTTFGYELKAGGFNKDAATYAGINGKHNIIRAMMISGALAGVGGGLNYLAGTGLSMSVIDVLSTEGFTGISVAFLGLNHPIGIIFSGVFVSYLFLGGARIQTFGFSSEVVEIVMAVIIYFCAFVFLVKSVIERQLQRKGKV